MHQELKFIIGMILMLLVAYLTHLVIVDVISNYPNLSNKDIKSMYFISYLFEIFIFVSIIFKIDTNK